MPNSDSPTTRISPRDSEPDARQFGDSCALTPDRTHGDSSTRAENQRSTTIRAFRRGDLIDHFLLVRLLGEGGFGQVWLAQDTRLGREVAIKLPHRQLKPETTELRRFQREAEVSAKLTHPNLIPILEAVLDQDQAYIVSEYCPGPTLLQWIRDHRSAVPPRVAVSIVAQLASGLKLAHDRGLIHRDIKPSNVIVADADTDHPIPRLTDFGMARMMSDVAETRAGTLIGSGPYMSPEQASGNIDQHGPHSDVHALGVLLYELLTGELPFASVSELDTIRRIVCEDPRSVRQVRPGLSRDISAVCQRCLEKQPTRRYHDAGELLEDLNRVLAGDPPLARPIGRVGRTWRWAIRNRALAALATMAVIGLIVGVTSLVVVAVQAERNARFSEANAVALSNTLQIAKRQRTLAQQQTRRAEFQRARAVEQQAIAQTAREQYRQTSYNSDISLAFQRYHQGHYGEVRKLLDRQIPQTGERELRTLEWWLLDREVNSRYQLWGSHSGRGTELVVLPGSENGPLRETTVVSAATDGSLLFWDVATGERRHQIYGLQGRLDAIATMPSGDLLIPGAEWPLFGRSVVAIDPTTGKVREVFHAHPTTIDSIRVSEDGSIIASGCRYDGIRCWSTTTRRSVSIRNQDRNDAFGLLLDGTRLVTSRRSPDALQVWDTQSGELIQQWFMSGFLQVATAHQHSIAAYNLLYKNGVGIVDATDLEKRRWIDAPIQPNSMEFSPDDSYIAISDARNGLELFERVDDSTEPSDLPPNYRSVAQVSGRGGRIEDIVFTADQEVVTISMDGIVERFAPQQSGHCIGLIEESDSNKMIHTHHPEGVISLNELGELKFFALGTGSAQQSSRAEVTAIPGVTVWKSSSRLNSLVMSDDRETIAVTDDAGDLHILSHWRDDAGRLLTPSVRTFHTPQSDAARTTGLMAVSATSRYVATSSNTRQIVVYDLARDSDEPIVRRWYENIQACIAFSPDEQSLFIGGFAGIDLVDLATGQSRFCVPDEDRVRRVAFSPLGTQLIVGLKDGSLTCLDQQTGAPLFRFHGIDVSGDHADLVASIGFISEDRLLTVGSESELHFWDLNERLQLGSFEVRQADDSRAWCRYLGISPADNELVIGLDCKSFAEVHRWRW